VTHVPENRHLVAKYSGLYAAELLVAYEMKKPHSWLPGDGVIRKFWWAYPAAMRRFMSGTVWATFARRAPGVAPQWSARCECRSGCPRAPETGIIRSYNAV